MIALAEHGSVAFRCVDGELQEMHIESDGHLDFTGGCKVTCDSVLMYDNGAQVTLLVTPDADHDSSCLTITVAVPAQDSAQRVQSVARQKVVAMLQSVANEVYKPDRMKLVPTRPDGAE